MKTHAALSVLALAALLALGGCDANLPGKPTKPAL